MGSHMMVLEIEQRSWSVALGLGRSVLSWQDGAGASPGFACP